MHTFGHPARIDDIINVCGRYGIPAVEDSAEALGSLYKGRHLGTFWTAWNSQLQWETSRLQPAVEG